MHLLFYVVIEQIYVNIVGDTYGERYKEDQIIKD